MTLKQLETLAGKFTWQQVKEDECTSSSADETYAEAAQCNFAYLEPLMSEWAACVKFYRADLCYEIMGIVEAAKALDRKRKPKDMDDADNPQLRTEYPLRIIGLRERGVDHPEYVECRMGDIRKGVYAAVYKVTIEKSLWTRGAVFTMRLYRAKM